MPSDRWTAERIALLRTLWAAGETANAIAARLGGMSRSAVLGKVFRLRLGAAGAAAKKSESQAKIAGRASSAPDKTASARELALARRRRGKRDKLVQTPPAPRSQHKSLLELTNDSCRWPHGRSGTFFFCGAPGADLEHGIPYCARHMRRAYVAPEYVVVKARQGALQARIRV